jgi:colicin import membrane protein
VASFARDYSSGLTWSIVGHVALLALLGMRLISLPAPEIAQVSLGIQATVIDIGDIQRREEADRQRQAELQQQREAAADKRRKQEAAAAEQQRKQEAVAAEKLRQQQTERVRIDKERAEQARVETQRKADAAREAKAARKAEEAERVAREKRQAEEARIAEQKRQEAIERQRIAALEAERQAQFQGELQAEEQRQNAVRSGKLAQYQLLIKNRVTRNWVRPASAVAGIECEVLVTQIPGGDVVNVRVGSCNGDASVVRSIIAAVEKSSPLPPPPDPSLFERNIRFTFRPEE